MANASLASHGACPPPFFQDTGFANSKGFIDGRVCQALTPTVTCCLPCPMTEFVYPDSFQTLQLAAQWIAVVSTIFCVFLMLSWAFLPVEKTARHYLSICLTIAVVFMNLGFVIPLAAKPNQCYDAITPNGMSNVASCAASGTFLILGGWGGVLWVFLRALQLHLQICWQVVVGRNFMWFAQALGWGIPILGIILAIIFSGVSFRFGSTCHINHTNSLADLWIPLLIFAAFTIILQFYTFGYCIKVYLASINDNGASTEGSGLPTTSYTNSVVTMTPRQAYRRVRRVLQLQWRGILLVLIIIIDVIFFSVIFVFQDNTVQKVKADSNISLAWVECIVGANGDKNKCLDKTGAFVVNEASVGAVLILLAMNGFWLLLLLGRATMVTGWWELLTSARSRNKREFVSVDARLDDMKKDTRSYEMLSREGSGRPMDDVVTPSAVVTPLSTYARTPLGGASRTTTPGQAATHFHQQNLSQGSQQPLSRQQSSSGRRTPDYFGPTVRYHAPARSFSNPRPPQQGATVTWDASDTYARPIHEEKFDDMNPLGMNRI